MKKEQKKEVKIKTEIKVSPLRIGRIRIPIRGKTPLVVDRFPPEVKEQILKNQTGEQKSGKEARDIETEIKRAIHHLPNGQIGFPARGFKAGMIESTAFAGGIKFSKKLIKGIKIVNAVDGLIPIKFKKKDILEHNIKSNTKFSPRFYDWSCEIEVEFDRNNVSETDIITLVNYAGYYYGIGIWGPRCKSSGDFGMYEVEMKK